MEEFALEPGERLVRTVRKHWFVLAVSLLPFLALAVLPLLAVDFLLRLAAEGGTPAPYASFMTPANPAFRALLGAWWLLLWTGAFNTFTQYYLNHWVITTLRIVRVRQYGFFAREVSSFLLERVQDVSTTVEGVFADLLGFGSVRVQTAGTAADGFTMDGIKDPTGMRDLIMSEVAALGSEGRERTVLEDRP